MQVLVEIDLTKDRALMNLCETNSQLVAMLKTFNAMDDGPESDSYLRYIGIHLWSECRFVATIDEYCDDYRFLGQTAALVFSFETTQEAACLFRMGSHAPSAVTIRGR